MFALITHDDSCAEAAVKGIKDRKRQIKFIVRMQTSIILQLLPFFSYGTFLDLLAKHVNGRRGQNFGARKRFGRGIGLGTESAVSRSEATCTRIGTTDCEGFGSC